MAAVNLHKFIWTEKCRCVAFRAQNRQMPTTTLAIHIHRRPYACAHKARTLKNISSHHSGLRCHKEYDHTNGITTNEFGHMSSTNVAFSPLLFVCLCLKLLLISFNEMFHKQNATQTSVHKYSLYHASSIPYVSIRTEFQIVALSYFRPHRRCRIACIHI